MSNSSFNGPSILQGATGPSGSPGSTGVSGGTGPSGQSYSNISATLTASSNQYTPVRSGVYVINLISSPNANFTVANPTGTAVNGDIMILRIYSGSNAYIPTFGTLYSSSGVATLPTSLVASKTVTLGFQYDSGRSLWVLLAIDSTGY